MGGEAKRTMFSGAEKHGSVMLIIDMTEAVTKILKSKPKCNGPFIYV
jgi:hypothetical protein